MQEQGMDRETPSAFFLALLVNLRLIFSNGLEGSALFKNRRKFPKKQSCQGSVRTIKTRRSFCNFADERTSSGLLRHGLGKC